MVRARSSGPRKDGRYVGAFYALTSAGTTKRVYVYGRTYDEAREKLIAEQAKVMAGIPVPDQSWKLGPLPRLLAGARRQADSAARRRSLCTRACIRLAPQARSRAEGSLRRLSVATRAEVPE